MDLTFFLAYRDGFARGLVLGPTKSRLDLWSYLYWLTLLLFCQELSNFCSLTFRSSTRQIACVGFSLNCMFYIGTLTHTHGDGRARTRTTVGLLGLSEM